MLTHTYYAQNYASIIYVYLPLDINKGVMVGEGRNIGLKESFVVRVSGGGRVIVGGMQESLLIML